MDSGYSTAVTPASGPTSGASDAPDDPSVKYWSLGQCRKAYLDYLYVKAQEVEEQKEARRYYHGSQWTEKQIKELNKRKQPVVTFNRVARKIDGTVGLIERLRQDPKAYARTPKEDQGAELATAAIRYVLDEQLWKMKSPDVARWAAIDGISGVEVILEQGDTGDVEIGFDLIDGDSFFYDPRSYRPDFSDARYMGYGKWLDLDQAIDLFPDKADQLKEIGSYSSELSTNPDREKRWFTEVGSKRLIRLVEVWYRHQGRWCFTVFTGYNVLQEGTSYLVDEKGKTECKFVMMSANVDHDGDRYGLIRNQKSAQDEFNHRRSKALHILNSRRLILSKEAAPAPGGVEKIRQEYARPDGVVVVETMQELGKSIIADDRNFDFTGQLKMLENAASELDNYGPNQALVGDLSNQSGRAIQLLQQAGMAELGPFILAYRNWKLRLYRVIWNALRKYWTGERWIRVTDDENVANYIRINGTMKDEYGRPIINGQTGQPVIENPIGSLDVDIIIDEGPDALNMQADSYDTLTVLASKGAQIPPQVLIELSPIPYSLKKKLLGYFQDDPMKQAAAKLQLDGEQAKVNETKSKTMLNIAKAHDLGQGEPDGDEQMPMHVQAAQAMADVADKQASARHKDAQTNKLNMETVLAPHLAAHDMAMDRGQLAIAARPKPERAEA